MLGTIIGSYRVIRQLGAGGMGKVYLAEHTELGKNVAVKVLKRKLCDDENMARRFANEAKASARINDPGIVDVIDIGRLESGSLYILMEYLDGETLKSRLRSVGHLPEDVAVALTRQITRALGAAHARDIVHRDIKPDNIFLVPDALVVGGERIKLLDFGIAKLMEADKSHVTRTNAMMGTPQYMSPEQCRGAGHVDHRTDFYSLGVVFYEMLCGRLPFICQGSGEYIIAHVRDPAPPIQQFNPAVSDWTASVVNRMLIKDPAFRFQSADELQTALAASGPQPRAASHADTGWSEPAMAAANAMAPIRAPANAPTAAQASGAGRTPAHTPPGSHPVTAAAPSARLGTSSPMAPIAPMGAPSGPPNTLEETPPARDALRSRDIPTTLGNSASQAMSQTGASRRWPMWVIPAVALALGIAVAGVITAMGDDPEITAVTASADADVGAIEEVEEVDEVDEVDGALGADNSDSAGQPAATSASDAGETGEQQAVSDEPDDSENQRAADAVERALASRDYAQALARSADIDADSPSRARADDALTRAGRDAVDRGKALLSRTECDDLAKLEKAASPLSEAVEGALAALSDKCRDKRAAAQKPRPSKPARPAPKPAPPIDELIADARKALMSGQYSKALKLCEGALRQRSSHGEAIRLCAIAACNLKHKRKAQRFIKRASSNQKSSLRELCARNGVTIQ